MNHGAFAACALWAVALAWSLPATAARTFDESTLTGTHSFTTIQMRRGETGEDPVVFCSGFGIIEFRGDRTAWLEGTERCSNDGVANSSAEERLYVAEDEPYFRIEEQVGGVFWKYRQLVRRGEMILCDGTLREPERLALHAVAVKQQSCDPALHVGDPVGWTCPRVGSGSGR